MYYQNIKSMEKYKPVDVAFGQSCINMNTDFSCRNNCIYCFGKNWEGRSVKFNPKDMIGKLPDNITLGNLPIGINNSASDPFQPDTIDKTMELVELLVERNVENIMIITKEMIPIDVVKRIDEINNVGFSAMHKERTKIFLFVSFSALPQGYENLYKDERIFLLRRLQQHAKNTPKILYARPIIIKDDKIINDLEKIILASDYVDAVVWSSVRVDDNIKATDPANLLPDATGSSLHKSHKRIPDELFQEIESTLINGCVVPVYRKTSCVISSILGIPDYNCHWSDPHHYGCNNCSPIQFATCQKRSTMVPVFDEYVQGIIDKYRLPAYVKSIPGAWILESNMETFSCLRAGILRKLTGFQVMFDWEGEYVTAENLAYKYYELRGEPEGNIPVNGFKHQE